MHKSRRFLVLASVLGATGVALGAFAAHGLRSTISSEMLAVFQTGVRYQMYHTFALFVACWLMENRESRKLVLAAWMFAMGIFVFSGSLYLLALTDVQSLGWITPLGGLSFIAGWMFLGWGIFEAK